MKRRKFLTGIGLAAGLPFTAVAQVMPPYRILWLSTQANSASDPVLGSFREGLRSHGLVEGRQIVLDARYASGPGGLPAILGEIAPGSFDLLVSSGPAIQSTRLTRDVPVLFSISGDPVELGIAKSLSRPGGNFTGSTFLSLDLAAKRVELLRDLVTGLRRIAVLSNTDHPGEASEWRATQNAAQALGVDLFYAPFSSAGEIDRALSIVERDRGEALLVFPDGVTMLHRFKVAAFANSRRIPSMFGWSEYCEAGGLMSYGADQRASYHRLAGYVVRLMRGEKPADLPIEQPTTFELTLNMRTAKEIGLTVPPVFLARADKVIE